MSEQFGIDEAHTGVTPPVARVRPSLAHMLLEGLRAAFFMPARWDRVHASPAILAFLLFLQLAIAVGVGRLYFDGEVSFNWRPVASGWGSMLLVLWACYTVRQHPSAQPQARSAADLVGVFLALGVWLSLATGSLFVTLVRAGVNPEFVPAWVTWLVYVLPLAWAALATIAMLLRGGEPDLGRRVQAVYAVTLAATLSYFMPPDLFWKEVEAAPPPEPDVLSFDQELVEKQAPLLQQKLAVLKPQRPGVPDMYTITFAPYEGEEVFRRETRMVGQVMASRFDAAGRQVALLNHAEEMGTAVWATPLNLQRAIAGVAAAMDREQDILFLYMTSHGAADGKMATNFWPLTVPPVTPGDVKKWLDAAGIRHRIVTVSACYSGSWIAPLANDDTLVMTAADKDHTSYGCGKKSELTFFGRAMFDEQLRTHTLSFEQAHAAARKVIARREKEAGKDDGYSNPQIRMGARIGPYLDSITRQRSTP